jgi:amino acid transporter
VGNLFPLVPIAKDAAGQIIPGTWNMAAVTLMAGGLFIAAWSTYAFETAVCYTREFRDPAKDTVKAIVYSGLLCLFVFTVVPLTFQGVLGLGQLISPAVTDAQGHVVQAAEYSGILNSAIYSGMGVAQAMATMIHASPLVLNIIIAMMILALMLAIVTSMAGSSRTLYQASVDGWLPRYLNKTNHRGAPTRAMWTDLTFNLLLLMMSDYVFVLAISNVCYIIFNFLNLNSIWIHRIDRPDHARPYRAPTILIIGGTLLSFVNMFLMGMGANVWGAGTLATGVIAALLIIPVFAFRHYVVDGGKFPESMMDDLHLSPDVAVQRRAGILPYLVLGGGIVTVFVGHMLAVVG